MWPPPTLLVLGDRPLAAAAAALRVCRRARGLDGRPDRPRLLARSLQRRQQLRARLARLTPALAAVDFTEPATLPPSLARAAATHNALSTDQLALARAYVAIDALPKTGHGGLSVYRPSGLPTAPPPLSQ